MSSLISSTSRYFLADKSFLTRWVYFISFEKGKRQLSLIIFSTLSSHLSKATALPNCFLFTTNNDWSIQQLLLAYYTLSLLSVRELDNLIWSHSYTDLQYSLILRILSPISVWNLFNYLFISLPLNNFWLKSVYGALLRLRLLLRSTSRTSYFVGLIS